MIPILSHIHTEKYLHYFVTTDKRMGVGFEIYSGDLESTEAGSYGEAIKSFLQSLSPQIEVKFKTKIENYQSVPQGYFRSDAMTERGVTERSYFIFLSVKPTIPILKWLKRESSEDTSTQLAELQNAIANLQSPRIIKRDLSEHELKKLFHQGEEDWTYESGKIHQGYASFSVIRLLKPSAQAFDMEGVCEILANFDHDYEITTSVRRVSEVTAKGILERKMKQAASGKAIADQVQESSLSESIAENFVTGSKLFNFELLIIVKHNTSSDSLSPAIVSNLKYWGDFKLEGVGVAPSFASTLVGSGPHVTLLEFDQNILGYLPIWSLSSIVKPNGYLPTSLLLHRRDNALHGFNLFDSAFDNYNALIIGTSGRGKSVMTGALTRSLLNDPRIQIIKLDVGGSHTKECELFGGTEYQLKLSEPSGINPFESVNLENLTTSEKTGILANFLSILILENGEKHFTKQISSEIENAVSEYIDSKPDTPCLQDFYDKSEKFPRRDLLRRWVRGGLYEAAFSATPGRAQGQRPGTEATPATPSRVDDRREGTEAGPRSGAVEFSASGLPHPQRARERLRYYNFSQIFQAANPEFAQAGVAAVLAQFNTEALISKDKRIVLICDEVPFFIRTCFDFFKFSTANVRKFGHSVVLIVQVSDNLIVNGDTGLIENSPQRFLFTIDGDEKEFQEKFKLTDAEMQRLRDGRTSRSSLLQTGNGNQMVRLKLTRKEYWELTSSAQDREKLKQLLEYIPNLRLEEAIACLSHT